MATDPPRAAGPAIHAVHPWVPGNPGKGVRHQLLSDDERARLAKISAIVRFKKGEQIYAQGDVADASFNVISGVVTSYRQLGDGEHITAFLHPGDLFGLTEEGRYVNHTRATTSVVAYKIPLAALRRIFSASAELDVDVIIKLCEELREAQRHGFLLAQKRAACRVAMFLDLQEQLRLADGEPTPVIDLPMDRSDVAAYLGLTLPAVSRAFRTLMSRKIIACPDRHHVRILDRGAFEQICDAGWGDRPAGASAPGARTRVRRGPA